MVHTYEYVSAWIVFVITLTIQRYCIVAIYTMCVVVATSLTNRTEID